MAKKDDTAQPAEEKHTHAKQAPVTTTQYEIERKEDGTILVKVTIPWKEAQTQREKVLDEMVKLVELPGFRKGMAPRELAVEKLSKEKVNEEVLKSLLSATYPDAITKNNIQPIANPRIHVEQFEEGTDIIYSAETAENPVIELKTYKDAVAKLTAASKIVVPGKEQKKPSLDEILAEVLKSTEAKIPQMIVDQETDRLLTQFLEELKTLGVTLDQYLATRGKKGEDLRKEYEEKARNDVKLEFVLRKIADEEKIEVEQEDIEKALGTLEDPKQREEITKNPYLLAAIIRQQKTLTFLSNL